MFHRIERQLRDVEVDQLPLGQAAILDRVRLISGLGEVALRELALVGDDQAAFAKLADVHLQRRRVHRDQHVGLVARGLDRARTEVDLECRDTEGRPLRSADFRRKIGKGREVVAGQRGRQSELAAGQLHAVAAVAREPHDHRFHRRLGFGLGFGQQVGGGRHNVLNQQLPPSLDPPLRHCERRSRGNPVCKNTGLLRSTRNDG